MARSVKKHRIRKAKSTYWRVAKSFNTAETFLVDCWSKPKNGLALMNRDLCNSTAVHTRCLGDLVSETSTRDLGLVLENKKRNLPTHTQTARICGFAPLNLLHGIWFSFRFEGLCKGYSIDRYWVSSCLYRAHSWHYRTEAFMTGAFNFWGLGCMHAGTCHKWKFLSRKCCKTPQLLRKCHQGPLANGKNATLGQTPESKPAPKPRLNPLQAWSRGQIMFDGFFRNNQQLRATCRPPCQKSHLWMTSLKGPAGSAFCWSKLFWHAGCSNIPKKFGAFSAGWGWEGSAWKSRPLQPSHTSGFVMIWQPQMLQGVTHELLKCQMSNS